MNKTIKVIGIGDPYVAVTKGIADGQNLLDEQVLVDYSRMLALHKDRQVLMVALFSGPKDNSVRDKDVPPLSKVLGALCPMQTLGPYTYEPPEYGSPESAPPESNSILSNYGDMLAKLDEADASRKVDKEEGYRNGLRSTFAEETDVPLSQLPDRSTEELVELVSQTDELKRLWGSNDPLELKYHQLKNEEVVRFVELDG